MTLVKKKILASIGNPIVEIRWSSNLHIGISYMGKMTYNEIAPSFILDAGY